MPNPSAAPEGATVIRHPAACTADMRATIDTTGNARLRSAGNWLSRVPDCDTDPHIIIHECLPRRLSCAGCERHPMNIEAAAEGRG